MRLLDKKFSRENREPLPAKAGRGFLFVSLLRLNFTAICDGSILD